MLWGKEVLPSGDPVAAAPWCDVDGSPGAPRRRRHRIPLGLMGAAILVAGPGAAAADAATTTSSSGNTLVGSANVVSVDSITSQSAVSSCIARLANDIRP